MEPGMESYEDRTHHPSPGPTTEYDTRSTGAQILWMSIFFVFICSCCACAICMSRACACCRTCLEYSLGCRVCEQACCGKKKKLGAVKEADWFLRLFCK